MEVSHWFISETRRALSVPGVQFSLGGLLRTTERGTVDVGNYEERGAFQVRLQYHVVRGSAWSTRYCTSSAGTLCSSKSVISVARKECGVSNLAGNPASARWRLTMHRISFEVRGRSASILVFRTAVRKRGLSLSVRHTHSGNETLNVRALRIGTPRKVCSVPHTPSGRFGRLRTCLWDL